jgi:hypothetical protein
MQGILKSNHQKLCNCLQDIKVIHPVTEPKLTELEEELSSVFKSYQQKMDDLKKLILIYGEKEKSIKNEIKKIRKYKVGVPQKNNKYFSGPVLNKLVVLLILLVQKILVSIQIDAAFHNLLY